MREILFRGKTYSGEWAYGSLILAGSYCCILEAEECVHPMDYPYLDNDLGTIDGQATPVDPETVGQFTGLLDKNGKKIFENDVIKTDQYDELASVMFNSYCGQFQVLFNDDYSEGLEDWHTESNHIEVIGNIYDNPELLGE